MSFKNKNRTFGTGWIFLPLNGLNARKNNQLSTALNDYRVIIVSNKIKCHTPCKITYTFLISKHNGVVCGQVVHENVQTV